MKGILSLLTTFFGCCAYVVFLEYSTRYDPACGNLLTFLQFAIISLEGFLITMRCNLKLKSNIPIREYINLTLFFFGVSIGNNIAFKFHISMTLHLVFRSSSLLANVALGVFLLNKKYDWSKLISVIFVTIGIFLCTFASGSVLMTQKNTTGLKEDNSFIQWCLGILILTAALIGSARMGHFQEDLFKKHGKHPREALFFTHLLPMPGFILFLKDIIYHSQIASNSEQITIFGGLQLPILWLYILATVFSQCICVNSVFILTSEYSSLTVTLVVTLRKFVSLLFSIFYFQNPFTTMHWIGTLFIFIGTLIYSDVCLPDLGFCTRKTKSHSSVSYTEIRA